MEEMNKDKTFEQRREELLKSRRVADKSNQTSQYIESLIEDVVLNGVSFDNQLPFLLSYAAREGLDVEQLKNDLVVLLEMFHPISKQPSKSEKMAILYQAQICHISEEVIQRILSELQDKKKQEQKAREKSEAERRARQNIIDNLISNMVYVEGGTFTMGASSEQGDDAFFFETPAHLVMLSSFSIGRYEVTQEEWKAVMDSNPSCFKGIKHPVEQVSWDDCQKFIRKLNAMTGKSFRLPTEAEWEFAARGGNKSKGYKYSGSNNIDIVAWYEDNSGKTTHPVGHKSPNELGLYDMSGNVFEWCSDWSSMDYYSSSPKTNPQGASSGSGRIRRGGSWYDSARYCRVSFRTYASPDVCSYGNIGFRLAL